MLAGLGLRDQDIDVYSMLPVGIFRRRVARFDMRNHRKLAIIDGSIGYAGSQNIVNADYGFHRGRITVNLAPASLRKCGAGLDLAIAVGILAAAGLYGTLLYTVGQRRRELGVRMALGSSRVRVQRQVVIQGLLLAVFGCVVGLAAAWVPAVRASRVDPMETLSVD